MKHAIRLIMLSLVMGSGMAHAGRSVDEPIVLREGTKMEPAGGSGGMTYVGRPSDSMALPPMQSEGEAEFAVMTVQSGESATGSAVYNGRPMDDPLR